MGGETIAIEITNESRCGFVSLFSSSLDLRANPVERGARSDPPLALKSRVRAYATHGSRVSIGYRNDFETTRNAYPT